MMKNSILKLGLAMALMGTLVLCQRVLAQDVYPEKELVPGLSNAFKPRPVRPYGIIADQRDESDRGSFVFGRDYLRVRVEYIYLPNEKNQTQGVSIRVNVKNKKELDFPFVIPTTEPGQVYSSLGEWEVVPVVALNEKRPLEIVQEIRTQRNRSASFGWVPSVVSTIADLFTGGASARLTNLVDYTQTARGIIDVYDKHTEMADINRFTLFPHAQENSFAVGDTLRWFSVFTKGTGKFHVWKKEDEAKANQKPQIEKIGEPEDNLIEREINPKYPTMYRIVTTGSPKATYYPAGKEAYIILKFERYVPYPRLRQNPEIVPNVVPHFNALRNFFKAQNAAQAKEDTNFQSLVDTEGGNLLNTLKELTNTGGLSLTDAGIVFEAFIRKAEELNPDGNSTVFNKDYLEKINSFPKESQLL